MVKASPPRRSRGGSRVRLALALGLAWPMALLAQPAGPGARPEAVGGPTSKGAPAPTAGAASRPGDAPRAVGTAAKKAGPAGAMKAEAPAAAKDDPVKPGGDVHRDERAEAVLAAIADFKPIKSGNPGAPSKDQVVQWAQGVGIVDKNKLDDYVRSLAAAMTRQSILDGLGAKKFANDEETLKKHEESLKAIERAFDDLLAPVTAATRLNPPRREFLGSYTDSLLKVMPELLANHLYARIEGMIVLSRVGDEKAIDTFIAQLNDRKQVSMVKLLSAYGLTNVARISRQINPKASLEAAIALKNYLLNEKDAIWPAQFRALEALGWLRQPATNALVGKFDMIDTAAAFLADEKAWPDVRAWAAWSIGMMRVPANARIDYTRIAGDIGKLAAELGDKILAVRSIETEDQARELIALLAVPIYNSVKGEPEQSRSGLVNVVALGKAAPFVTSLDPLLKAVAASAVQLGNAQGQQMHRGAHDALEKNVKALKNFLAQNPQQVVAGGATGAAGAR